MTVYGPQWPPVQSVIIRTSPQITREDPDTTGEGRGFPNQRLKQPNGKI